MRQIYLLLAITLLLASCSSGAPEAAEITAPPAEAGAAVTIGFGAPEHERPLYEPLIAVFNQQNPSIRVEFIALDAFSAASDPAQVLRRIAGAADTAMVTDVRVADLQAGLLHDLKPLLDADPSFAPDDLYPGALDVGSLNDGIYLLPRSLHVALLSYNQELWAARGLPAPRPDWRWSDLKATAEQLARRRGDVVDIYGLLDWGAGYPSLLAELDDVGVDLLATPDGQLTLDRPEVAAAIERVAALARSGALYLRPRVRGEPATVNLRQLIVDGHAAIWPREMLFVEPNGAQPAFAIGIAPDPRTPPVPDTASGYMISSGTQHPQDAWRWLSFLSQQALVLPGAVADGLSELPPRKSVAERSGYWSRLDAETAAAVQAAIQRPHARRGDTTDLPIFAPLNTALNAVVNGEQTAGQALHEAQAALDQQIAQGRPSATPESGPVVVATPQGDVALPGATTIRFGAQRWETEQIRDAVRAFNQNNPEIFVQLTEIEPTSASFGLAEAAATSDCFLWWQTSEPPALTATLDLQPLLDADPAFDSADYPSALLAPFGQGGGLYGLPYAIGWPVLTYNKEAFDAAGLGYPGASWSLDDFLNAAQALTSGSGADKRYGFASISSPAQELLFFMELFGASATTGSGSSIAPNFTDPQVAQAARYYIQLLRDYSPNRELQGYRSSTNFGIEFFELLNAGRIGMWFGSGDMFLTSPESRKITRLIAPPPMIRGAPAAEDFRSSGLFISRNTQQISACWRWLKHLSAIPPAADPNPRFPARSSVAASDAFLSQAPAGSVEVYQAYRAALDRTDVQSARTPIARPPMDLFWFFRAVDRGLRGQDLDRELAEAQALTEQFLACVRNTAKPSTCAKQVDPSYDGWASRDT